MNVPSPKISQEYASFTNQGFQLKELCVVAALVLKDHPADEARRLVLDENVLQLRSAHTRSKVLGIVLKRLAGAPQQLLDFLAEGNYDLRRLTNLYLILLQHRLLREFLAEIVREQLRSFNPKFDQSEVSAFMERKREQSAEIAAWSDTTFAKARSNLIKLCIEAELLSKNSGELEIQPQLIPGPLRAQATEAGHHEFLRLMLDQESL